ncbi:MAG: hypothetical protein WCG27_08895 [Pseudomonadota bacterium]
MNKTKRKIYGVSWIANLGVVPLLRSFFLRLAPDRHFLRFLLTSVAHVLETICPNLFFNKTKLSSVNLLGPRPSVKILLWGFLHCANFYTVLAQEPDPAHTIILATGEHWELMVPELQKYTIGNHDIVVHRFDSLKKQLLLKGNKLGHTEMVIWKQRGAKERYQIYVLTKQKQMSLLHLAETIKNLGLSVDVTGAIAIVSGTVDQFTDFQLLKKLKKMNPDNVHFKASLSPRLRNQMIGEIYKILFDDFIDDIRCTDQELTLYCSYVPSNAPEAKMIDYLQKHYGVVWIPRQKHEKGKNYRLRLKLFQLEQLTGEEIRLGLEQISGDLGEFFYPNGALNVLKRNKVLLSSQNLNFSTLAEPEILIRLDNPADIQLGSEIPYTARVGGQNSDVATSWKFVGLKINVKLTPIGEKLQVSYQTELSSPGGADGKVQGGKQSSTATVEINRPLELFQIGLRAIGESSEALPWISKIPILGELFKSKSNHQNYKKISAILLLEDYAT